MQLEGKVAAITGGTAGIGRAIAEAFVAEGAQVVVSGRNADRGQQVADEIGVVFCQGDATTKEGVEQAVEAAVSRFGRIDIMVNNAGGAERLAPLVDLYDEDWDLVMKWNLYSTFWGTRAALRHMLPRGYGRIINISSVEGKHGKPVLTPYVAAKHGLLGLMRSLSAEYAQSGVTFNCVCPSYVDTPMTEGAIQNIMHTTGRSRDQALRALWSPQGRLIDPEEVAAVCLLLAGPHGRSINGQAINVDGGQVQS